MGVQSVREVKVGEIPIGNGNPLVVIAGPCAIENEGVMFKIAGKLKAVCADLGLGYIFKSSYDKANRTSINSFRGPGIDRGLRMLGDVREEFSIPVISDVHLPEEVKPAAKVLDALQIPAFLCRQTDLVVDASKTGKPVNVKKGQFLAPWDMGHVIDKFVSTGNQNLLITERGTSFGYNNLVVDFRGFPVMKSFGYPVLFDVTHSLQLPGAHGNSSGGQVEFAAPLARAAVAAGVDGLYLEVHPEPSKALSDGSCMIPLDQVEALLRQVKRICEATRTFH